MRSAGRLPIIFWALGPGKATGSADPGPTVHAILNVCPRSSWKPFKAGSISSGQALDRPTRNALAPSFLRPAHTAARRSRHGSAGPEESVQLVRDRGHDDVERTPAQQTIDPGPEPPFPPLADPDQGPGPCMSSAQVSVTSLSQSEQALLAAARALSRASPNHAARCRPELKFFAFRPRRVQKFSADLILLDRVMRQTGRRPARRATCDNATPPEDRPDLAGETQRTDPALMTDRARDARRCPGKLLALTPRTRLSAGCSRARCRSAASSPRIAGCWRRKTRARSRGPFSPRWCSG